MAKRKLINRLKPFLSKYKDPRYLACLIGYIVSMCFMILGIVFVVLCLIIVKDTTNLSSYVGIAVAGGGLLFATSRAEKIIDENKRKAH